MCQPHQFYLKKKNKILSLLNKDGGFFDLKNSLKIKDNPDYKVFTL